MFMSVVYFGMEILLYIVVKLLFIIYQGMVIFNNGKYDDGDRERKGVGAFHWFLFMTNKAFLHELAFLV